jgi:predicted Zn-dependent protease
MWVAAQAGPGDVVVAGPLWDDERFFGYYYPHPQQVMRPPTLAFGLPGIAAEMAETNGRLWLVTRQASAKVKGFEAHHLYGVTILVQQQPNYDPVAITWMGAELCAQAAKGADEWAAEMVAGGVLTPDVRASKAGAYLCQGDTYAVRGDYEAALKPYQKMVEVFPGWAGGYATLAKTYLTVDNLPAAAAAFAQAVRFNPAWQGHQADKAASLMQTQQWAEAVTLYEQIIE